MTPTYTVARATTAVECTADWEGRAWRDVPALSIDRFHPDSTTRSPKTQARLLLAERALHVIFLAEDECVRSVATRYQDPVSQDSCVELFVEPRPGRGYFNFEWNCGGVMLLFHIVDATRVGDTFRNVAPVREELAALVQVATTMPRTTPVEIPGPVRWVLAARIPLEVMEACIGPIEVQPGMRWRANLYKCAGDTSRPHWASWSDIGSELNFHQPDRFGVLQFEDGLSR